MSSAAASDSSASVSGSLSTFEYRVGMTCDGCKGAITRILSKLPGITHFDASVEQQRLIVTGSATQEEISERLSKWAAASGKEVKFIQKIETKTNGAQ